MAFTDRFEDPSGSRIALCFKEQVSTANAIKDDWAFIWENALRYNIAYALQSLTAPEYADYTPKMANDALDTLERFRAVALIWTVGERREAATGQAAAADSDFRSVPSAMVGDFTTPDDDIPF